MCKKYHQLSSEERAVIMIKREEGCSVRAIARTLHRSPSTISRELKRNGLRPYYCASIAARQARERRHVRLRKLFDDYQLWKQVQTWLKVGWSPLHIAGRLKETGGATVCAETIYATIYALPRGGLRQDLIKALRRGHKTRRPRSAGNDRRQTIPDLRSIHERPVEANSRQVPGHWEGDLLKGKSNKSAIASLVERTSRYLILCQVDDATSPSVTGQFIKHFDRVPEALRQSLTYDRGKEMTNHADITEKLGLAVYFADPYAPWQRGTNEQTNGLVRQFIPKGTDLTPYTQHDLDHIARLINHRPRKCLNFKTPFEVYYNVKIDYGESVALRS